MYLTVKQQLKHLTKEEYLILRELTHIAKNLVNESIYEVRQHYFNTKEYLDKHHCYHILKNSPNYKILNSNVGVQLIAKVDLMFKSFFGLIRAKKAGAINKKVRLPQYLDKTGFYSLIVQEIPKFENGKYYVPYSRAYAKTHKRIQIKLPPILVGKTIKEIRIVPRYNARFFEVHYVYEQKEDAYPVLDNTKALAIDLGINNFATCVSSDGDSFIIDGKKLKSYNQWYNKKNVVLDSIKTRQKYGNDITKRQAKLANKRNNRVLDIISKASRYIINYCLERNIGNLVLGYRDNFQLGTTLGKKLNQLFCLIPFGQFKDRLEYLCSIYGINLIIQEESYTSKASFFDDDEIPIYDKDDTNVYTFSGIRTKRGLYKTSTGMFINADVNGALNILKKSKVVPEAILRLYCSGELNTPIRIRLHK